MMSDKASKFCATPGCVNAFFPGPDLCRDCTAKVMRGENTFTQCDDEVRKLTAEKNINHRLPTVTEELERKVMETLMEWVNKANSGQASREAAKAALQALWGASAGLVSKELMETIADATDAIEIEADQHPRCVVVGKGGVLAILSVPEECKNTSKLRLFGKGSVKAKTIVSEDNDLTLSEAAAMTAKTLSRLYASGFEDLE